VWPEDILVPYVCGHLLAILAEKDYGMVYDIKSSAKILVRLDLVSFFVKEGYLRVLPIRR